MRDRTVLYALILVRYLLRARRNEIEHMKPRGISVMTIKFQIYWFFFLKEELLLTLLPTPPARPTLRFNLRHEFLFKRVPLILFYKKNQICI